MRHTLSSLTANKAEKAAGGAAEKSKLAAVHARCSSAASVVALQLPAADPAAGSSRCKRADSCCAASPPASLAPEPVPLRCLLIANAEPTSRPSRNTLPEGMMAAAPLSSALRPLRRRLALAARGAAASASIASARTDSSGGARPPARAVPFTAAAAARRAARMRRVRCSVALPPVAAEQSVALTSPAGQGAIQPSTSSSVAGDAEAGRQLSTASPSRGVRCVGPNSCMPVPFAPQRRPRSRSRARAHSSACAASPPSQRPATPPRTSRSETTRGPSAPLTPTLRTDSSTATPPPPPRKTVAPCGSRSAPDAASE